MLVHINAQGKYWTYPIELTLFDLLCYYGIKMKKCCGNCRQFIRSSGKPVDLCGAWGNPTTADRPACDFWMLLVKKKNQQQVNETE